MNQNQLDNQVGQNEEIDLFKDSSVISSPTSKRKFPAKQIYNVWLSLKKFNQNSLEKIKRNSPRLTRRKRFHGTTASRNENDKELLDKQFSFAGNRFSSSHPELSYSNLAQLSNYQSFDDINLRTVHHNSDNYLSDNIEFHRVAKQCCSLAHCRNGSICGLYVDREANDDDKSDVVVNVVKLDHNRNATTTTRTSKTFGKTTSLDKSPFHEKTTINKPQLSLSGTSSPTSFFSRFRSSSPNPDSTNESVKDDVNKPKYSNNTDQHQFPSITTTNCSTFLPKRPHSSLNYSDSTPKRAHHHHQFSKQGEAFSASEEDLLVDTNSEQQSVSNYCATASSKRRDSFLLKLLKKRKSTERNPLDRMNSATNYEYYNQSLDEDYENSVSQNPQDHELKNQPPSYHFYLLEVYLNSASNLRAKDRAGTSDPYVKFKIGNKVLFKSRIIYKELNPKFDEFFTLPIDNLLEPVQIKVYDYDFGFTDDFLGAAQIDLNQLKLNEPEELILKLTENGKPTDPDEDWGCVELCVTLVPKTLAEREQYYSKDYKLWGEGSKKHKTQEWDSVVNIVLIEARNLPAKDSNGLADPYVRFKLGNEKYKSKVVFKCLNPIYNEQFDLHTFPNQSKILEISVYDNNSFSDEFIGKNAINLNCLNKEETHEIIIKLDGLENAELVLLLTISGIKNVDEVDNNSDYAFLTQSYSLEKSFQNLNDVGFLVVKVIKAEDLMAADFSGKSDPFCVLELVNNRLQTNTVYKNLSPVWNKTFEFRVRDIHESLVLTVYDEDSDKNDFLGQVVIPLLNINNDQLKWYQLKDQTCLKATKGRIRPRKFEKQRKSGKQSKFGSQREAGSQRKVGI